MSQDDFENKCELCGLLHAFSQATVTSADSVECLFKKWRALQRKGLVPKGYPRVVHASSVGSSASDLSEVCAINHPSWRKSKKCRWWQPKLGMTLAEHISLHEAKKMGVLTKQIYWLTGVAALSALISAGASFL